MNQSVEEDVSWVKTVGSLIKRAAWLQEKQGQGLLTFKAALFFAG